MLVVLCQIERDEFLSDAEHCANVRKISSAYGVAQPLHGHTVHKCLQLRPAVEAVRTRQNDVRVVERERRRIGSVRTRKPGVAAGPAARRAIPFRSAVVSSHANTSESSLHRDRKCLRNRRIAPWNGADSVSLTRFVFLASRRLAGRIIKNNWHGSR